MSELKICPKCHKNNDADQRFCMVCGMDMDDPAQSLINGVQSTSDQISSLQEESTIIIPTDRTAKLILPDKILDITNETQRLIGRADLKKYTKKNLNLISRSHFTVYQKNSKPIICDGRTTVQDKSSSTGTFLNGTKIINEQELKNGDTITVSDIDILFEG